MTDNAILTDKCKEICSEISMQQVLDLYGIKTHHDKAKCPLPGHEDKEPSFKIYGLRGFHCFGCSQSGSVVDFVRIMDGITTIQAANKLCHEFGLPPLKNSQLSHEQAEKAKLMKRTKAMEEFMLNFFVSCREREEVSEWAKENMSLVLPIVMDIDNADIRIKGKYSRIPHGVVNSYLIEQILYPYGKWEKAEVDNLAKRCGELKKALEMLQKDEKRLGG